MNIDNLPVASTLNGSEVFPIVQDNETKQVEINKIAEGIGLAEVATSGSYNDLTDKPTIPEQVQSDWNEADNTKPDYIKNKPNLSTVATSGSYNDLLDKPSIPAAQVNSDWDANSGVSQILNKPSLSKVATSGDYNDLNNKPSVAVIDDTQASASKVYSSNKVENLLGNKANALSEDLETSINDEFATRLDSTILTSATYIKASNGTLVSSNSWSSSANINVKGYGFIYLTMATFETATDAGIAFYDSETHFISGVAGRVTGVAGYEKKYVKVPKNAEYLKVSFRNSDSSNFFLCYGNKLTNLYDHIYTSIDMTKLYEWEKGTINQVGAKVNSYGYYRTDYISVESNSELDITVGENAVFVFEYKQKDVFIKTDETTGGKKYTTDSTHTLNPLTNYIKLVTRKEPLDTSASISIVDNISVIGKVFSFVNYKDANENTNLMFGLQMFEKIGVISDSISVGWAKDKNGNNSRRNTGISWVQQLARRLGCTAYNLGASGVDPIEWFQPNFEFAEYCYTQYQSVGFCDLYIVGLGLNGGTLGTIADIDENDYTQNASSFYGQYARIIQMINDEHPNAIVVCLTEPTTRISEYDQAVRDICALNFINAQLLDLENDYFDIFKTPEMVAEKQPDGLHYTPYGYSLIAEAMAYALNDYIKKHSSEFKYVGVTTV